MRDMSRREAMETILLASAGLTVTTLTNAEAQTPAAPKVFAGQHKPTPLPFNPTRLKGISEKLIQSHWEITTAARSTRSMPSSSGWR